jgi:ATP-binding protein involved in chromosome partitioning
MSAPLTGLKKDGDHLLLRWQDGLAARISVRQLRLACPCAFCVNEVTGERMLDPDSIPDSMALKDMQPVGHYAYRILFEDGHDTGLFTLETLRSIGEAAQEVGP